MEELLVNQEYLLQKTSGKGGWTYVDLPQIIPNRKALFGWVKVKGTIDGFEIKKYHLMPYGNGKLFLPVKAEIRKKIKKEAGDYVQVILYFDNEPTEIPKELLLCLQDEPAALEFFNSLNENEKLNYIKWIYSAKSDDTKTVRIATTIERLLKHEKFYEK
jgi:hypothetical protein